MLRPSLARGKCTSKTPRPLQQTFRVITHRTFTHRPSGHAHVCHRTTVFAPWGLSAAHRGFGPHGSGGRQRRCCRTRDTGSLLLGPVGNATRADLQPEPARGGGGGG